MGHQDRARRTPWGKWQVLARGDGFQVKRLEVNPGRRFSLQFHYRRTEHWVVVAGTGRVTLGARTRLVRPGQSLFIAKKVRHRLHNTGRSPLGLRPRRPTSTGAWPLAARRTIGPR